MSTPIKLIVHGAAGRMGRRVLALADEDTGFQLTAAIDHEKNPLIGQDAGLLAGVAASGVLLGASWPADAEAVIDFSLPTAVDACLQEALQRKFPLVVATTGLNDAQKQALKEASSSIPICWAPSMSMAVNLTMKLTQQVTETLKGVAGGLDVEIIERHHRFKADAPSGTALRFGELVAEKMDGDVQHVHGREGETGERSRHEIGYHAVRVGDNPGEHTIVFGMMGERIELNVAASNRDCYALGALEAARWLQGKPVGLYNMFDVLGLS